MNARVVDRGARRREIVRSLLGKPGSLGRWLLFTFVWVGGLGFLMSQVGWGLRIIVMLFLAIVPIAAFRYRELLIGDEDELRVALRRDAAQAIKSGPLPENDDRLAPEDWLSRGGRVFLDVPPPPSAEPEQGDEMDPEPLR